MTAKPNRDNWDAQVRPHLTPYFAYVAAFVIAAAHIVVGLLLKIKSSGVIFQTADQVAMAGLGFVLAGLVLLFARPRLRVGAAGLSVRNMLGDRLVPWSDVVGVSFPAGARWARIDLPDAALAGRARALHLRRLDSRRRVGANERRCRQRCATVHDAHWPGPAFPDIWCWSGLDTKSR